MSKFKVGDKVKVVDPSNWPKGFCKVGDICTVRHVDVPVDMPDIYIETVRDSDGRLLGGYEKRFDFLESELEHLVRVANEGIEAFNRIYHHHASQVRPKYSGPKLLEEYSYRDALGNALELAPKPAFEPFYVGGSDPYDSWKVELKGDTLHIGCQEFNARNLYVALDTLCRRSGASVDTGNGRIQAMRGYVEHASGNQISWADADRILTALEKAGV